MRLSGFVLAERLGQVVAAAKAVDEAKKIGKVHVAATTKAEQFTRIPRAEEIVLTPGAAYVHITTNNTIYGTYLAGSAQTSAAMVPTSMAGRRRVISSRRLRMFREPSPLRPFSFNTTWRR